MASVQYRGIENVLQAYVDRDVPAWALWCGKQFLIPFVTNDMEEGRAHLETVLQKLQDGGTNAIYTLKVYEDLTDGKIKERTPADGSFNFQLNAQTMTVYEGKQQYIGSIAEITSKISAIERKLNEGPPEAEPTTYDRIMDFADSDVGKMVIGKLIDGLFPSRSNYIPQAISGIPQTGDNDKLNKAIEILKKNDPQLEDHLQKLAEMSESNPANFKILLGMLDQL